MSVKSVRIASAHRGKALNLEEGGMRVSELRAIVSHTEISC